MEISEILEMIDEINPEALKMDGYDDCILGICRRFGMESVLAYDEDKVLQKLVDEGMTWEEAREWFEFNQIGAWMGEGTPVFLSNKVES